MNEIVSLTVKKGNQQEENIIKFIDQTEKQINDEKQPSIFSSKFLSFSDFEIVQNKLIEQGKSPLGELIGRGSEADIYRSEDQKVVYRVGQAEDRQKYQDFIQEFEIVKSMKNSVSIINYQDALFIDSIRVAIIQMEECQCSLFQELKNYSLSNEKLSFTHFLNIMFDLFDGLIELRSHNIINSDIKPGNILKTKDNIYIISDFGISLKTRDQQTRIDEDEIKGYTPGFFPESFEHAYQIDLYAVGVTLLYVLRDTQTNSLSQNFQQQIIKYLKRQEDKQIECKDIPSIFLSQLQEQEFLPFLMKYLNKINSIIRQDLYDVKKNIFQSTQALLSYLQMKESIISFLLKSEENLTNSVNQQQVLMNQELTSRDSLLEELLRDIYMSGRIYMQLGKLDSARGIFLKILDELAKNVNLEQKKSIWMKAKCMRKLGRCDEQELNIEESLRLQTETLDFLLKSPLSSDLITIQQYWIVSQCYSQLSNEEEAKQYFEIFRSYIDRQQLKSAKQYMSLLYSIGYKYLNQNKLELAAKYLTELKDLYAFNQSSSINLKEANCYLQLGKLCLKIQEQQTSLFLINKSIVPQTENKQLDHLIWRSTNQINEALLYFQKSLQIKERVYHKNHLCFSELYIYIGECYTYLEEKNNASDSFERAFKIRFEAFKQEHPLTQGSIFQWLLFYYRTDDIQNPQVERLMGYLKDSKYLNSYKKALSIITDEKITDERKQSQIQNIVNIILNGGKKDNQLNTLLRQLNKDNSINILELFRQTENFKCDEDLAQSAKTNEVQWFLKSLTNQINEKLNDKQRHKKKIDDDEIEQKIQHQEELTSDDIQNILSQLIGRKGLKSLKLFDFKYNHITFEGDLGNKQFKSETQIREVEHKIYLTCGKCPHTRDLLLQNILIQQNPELQTHNLSFLHENQTQQFYFGVTSKALFTRIKAFLMESDSAFIENQIIQKRIAYQIVKIVVQLAQDNHTISEVNLDNFYINPRSLEVIFFVNQFSLKMQSLIKKSYNQQIKFYLFRAALCLLYIDNYSKIDEQYSVIFSDKIFEENNSEECRPALKKLAQIKRNTYAFKIVEKLLNVLNQKDINLDEVYEQLFPQILNNEEREIVNRQHYQIGFLKIDNNANLNTIDFSSLKILEIVVGVNNSINFSQVREFLKAIWSKFPEMTNLDSFSMTFNKIADCLSSELLIIFSDQLKICNNLKSLTLRIAVPNYKQDAALYLLDTLQTLQKLERLTLSLRLLNIEEIQAKLQEVIFLLPVLNHFEIDEINLQLFQKLQPAIANAVNLESLDLQFKIDEGYQEFQEDTFPQTIQKLRLHFSEITHQNLATLLSQGIGQCLQLSDLYLKISFDTQNYVNLLNHSNFQGFQLSRLEIDVIIKDSNEQDIFTLIGVIVSEQRYLKQLILSLSQLSQLPLKVNFQTLFTGISNCTQLNTLILSLSNYIEISETDSLLFSDSLVLCDELQHFEFRTAYNNPKAIYNIFKGSNKFKKLTHLSCSLEYCRINSQEAYAISSMLQMCTHLKSLDLNISFNPLGNVGVQLIGEGISYCNQLRDLTFQMERCQLKSQNIFNICLPITTLRVLQKLYLYLPFNEMDNTDIQILESILPQCTNLNILKFSISLTNISMTQMYNLFQGISMMKSLYSFSHTWSNQIPSFINKKLFKSLRLVQF